MPSSIESPSLRLTPEPLTAASFSSFGTVIENPKRSPPSNASVQVVSANQGTAKKYIDMSLITSFYALAPSKKPSKAVINLFVCSPRKLRLLPSFGQKALFDVKVLERHPYTSQTFVPMGLSTEDAKHTKYLVIIAPTLPASHRSKDEASKAPAYPLPEPKKRRSLFDIFSRARPSPFTNEAAPPVSLGSQTTPPKPKGPGMPDLANAKAFIATGNQAVTYGAGTWHAPMVVLGREDIDFVVVQYANGVPLEDCQEVELESEAEEGIAVEIDGIDEAAGETEGMLRARL